MGESYHYPLTSSNLSGRLSPKNTISGLIRPLHTLWSAESPEESDSSDSTAARAARESKSPRSPNSSRIRAFSLSVRGCFLETRGGRVCAAGKVIINSHLRGRRRVHRTEMTLESSISEPDPPSLSTELFSAPFLKSRSLKSFSLYCAPQSMQ